MNTAVADSFDIGWKLAAVLKGHGGPHLLDAYELERRPVAQRAIERSGVHWTVHSTIWGWVRDSQVSILSDDAQELKDRIRQHATTYDGENRDKGIEYGYRYNNSIIICQDEDGTQPPPYLERSYVPSTWPGVRPPHVFLKDGETSIFDLFGQGPEFSLVDFTQDARYAGIFVQVTRRMKIPLKAIHLPDEEHLRKIWERDAVLLRPDDHVAWRASVESNVNLACVEDVMKVVSGNAKVSPPINDANEEAFKALNKTGFTGTVGNVNQDNVEMKGVFQV